MNNDKVAPLTSDNYPSRKQDTIAILLDHNVYGIVLGKESPPGDDASKKEKLCYKKRCNTAFSSIYLNVSKDLRPLIADITEGNKAWEEAIRLKEAEQWKAAMDAEMQNMKSRKVCCLVLAPPKEVKIVGCHWVYNLKKNNEGKVVHYQARF
ncbi:hypothetical protein AVEN_225197-1 [Araneus ventricosus]|uniref:Reverse transcriptase Ty1/copia-type domain-containing protein n=1 Tax=Araneus ventricosus TaxID=182803 RepID=A0A4Y2AMK0_ARAVE|nr:hypothetical protein AVEN_225197-1 [Araneus ventricosus]